jgi:hypothetical protein
MRSSRNIEFSDCEGPLPDRPSRHPPILREQKYLRRAHIPGNRRYLGSRPDVHSRERESENARSSAHEIDRDVLHPGLADFAHVADERCRAPPSRRSEEARETV